MSRREGFSLFGCVGLVLVFLIVFPLVMWGIGVWAAPWVGRGEAHKQLNSAEFRIQAYDHFHNLCSSIQGNEGQIDALQAQLNETESERNRDILRSSIAGVQGSRMQAISQYNADATKNYTVGQFRDNDLPYRIEPMPYPNENGVKTTCAYQ